MLKRGVGAAARRRTTSNFVRNARTKNDVYLQVNYVGVQCRLPPTFALPIESHSDASAAPILFPYTNARNSLVRGTPRDPNRQRLSRFKTAQTWKIFEETVVLYMAGYSIKVRTGRKKSQPKWSPDYALGKLPGNQVSLDMSRLD